MSVCKKLVSAKIQGLFAGSRYPGKKLGISQIKNAPVKERKARPIGNKGTKIAKPRLETKVIKAVISKFIVISFVKLTIYTVYIS